MYVKPGDWLGLINDLLTYLLSLDVFTIVYLASFLDRVNDQGLNIATIRLGNI